jgi:hypothetical protein
MRGHENLIRLRTSGFRPLGSVLICDFPVSPEFLEWKHAEDAIRPTVCVDGDPVGTLDLRFVVGLSVLVIGEDVGRAKELAGMVRRAGATSVIATAGDNFAAWKKGDEQWLKF